jgi:serine/threonine-protein kinase RsbW
MASETTPWTLTLASELRLLPMARAFVEGVCRTAGFDDRTTHAIVLAADEAVNNVMRHAHRDRPNASLRIQCFIRPDALEIRLHDEGEPFDIAAVPHLDPAELRVGGRGVFLMRTIMDELSVERGGDKGNVLRMLKRRPPHPAPAAS